MEVFFILFALAAVIGLLIGVVMGIVAYLRAVSRGADRGADWVQAVLRVAFPLFAGVAACHAVMGARRMEAEMGSWYWYVNVAAIGLATLALAHVVIRARVRRGDGGDRVIALGLLTLIVGAPSLCTLLFYLGENAPR